MCAVDGLKLVQGVLEEIFLRKMAAVLKCLPNQKNLIFFEQAVLARWKMAKFVSSIVECLHFTCAGLPWAFDRRML